ncbi:cyclodeaminase/cyclohydrolase family protein [Rhizobium sp. OAE497]|uniref:cyclodeaminase/cyclohydrolase family protein n=1 Tax=Rhizobium sp. OAE497 TaxID=2663796 RepID=UPI00160D91EB
MKLLDMRLGDLLSQIGQSKPSISGSTASLIAGRLGIAMIRMALAVSSEHGTNNDLVIERLDSISARLIEAAEQDRAAALSFIEALREEATPVDRRRAITGATLEPLSAAHVLIELLEHAVDAVSGVEPSVASDFFGGVELIGASFSGAMMAVESNLKQDAAEDLSSRTLQNRAGLRARQNAAMATLRLRRRAAGLYLS